MTYDSHWDAIKPHASSIWDSFVPSAAFTQGKKPIGLANSHHILLFDGQVHYSIYIHPPGIAFREKVGETSKSNRKPWVFCCLLVQASHSWSATACSPRDSSPAKSLGDSGWLWVILGGYGWFWWFHYPHGWCWGACFQDSGDFLSALRHYNWPILIPAFLLWHL